MHAPRPLGAHVLVPQPLGAHVLVPQPVGAHVLVRQPVDVHVLLPQRVDPPVPQPVETSHHSPEIPQAMVPLPADQPAVETALGVGACSSLGNDKEKKSECEKEPVIVVSDNEDEHSVSHSEDLRPESAKTSASEEQSVKRNENIVLENRISLPLVEQDKQNNHPNINKNTARGNVNVEALPKYVLHRTEPVGSHKTYHGPARARQPQKTTFFGTTPQQQQNIRLMRMPKPVWSYVRGPIPTTLQSPEHVFPRFPYLHHQMPFRPRLYDQTGSSEEIRKYLLTNRQTVPTSKQSQQDVPQTHQRPLSKRSHPSEHEDVGGKIFVSNSSAPGESQLHPFIPSQQTMYSVAIVENSSTQNIRGQFADPQHQLDNRPPYLQAQMSNTMPQRNLPSSQPPASPTITPQMAKSLSPCVPEGPHFKQQSKDSSLLIGNLEYVKERYAVLPPHLSKNALGDVPVFTVPGDKEQLIPIYPSHVSSKTVNVQQGHEHHIPVNRFSPRAASASPRAMSTSPRIIQAGDPEANLNFLKRIHSDTYQNTQEHQLHATQAVQHLGHMHSNLPVNQGPMTYFQRRASRSTNSSPGSTAFSPPPPVVSPHGLSRMHLQDTITGTPLDTGRSSRSPQVSIPKSRSTPSASPHVIEEERSISRPPSSNPIPDHNMSSAEVQPLDLTCKTKTKPSIPKESEEPNSVTSRRSSLTGSSFTNSSNEKCVAEIVLSSKPVAEMGIDLSKTSNLANLPPSVDPHAKNVEYFAQWISSTTNVSKQHGGKDSDRQQKQHTIQQHLGTHERGAYSQVESTPSTSAVSIERANAPVAYNQLVSDGLTCEGPGLSIDKTVNPNSCQSAAVELPLHTVSRAQDMIIPSFLNSQIPLMELKRAPSMPFPQAPSSPKQQLSTSSTVAIHQTPPVEHIIAEVPLGSSYSNQTAAHSEESSQKLTENKSNDDAASAGSITQESSATNGETVQQPSEQVKGMEPEPTESVPSFSETHDYTLKEKQDSSVGSECGESVSQESEVQSNVSMSSETSVSSLKRPSSSSDLTQCPKKRFIMTHEASLLADDKKEESGPSIERQTSSSDDDSLRKMEFSQPKVIIRDVMSSPSRNPGTNVPVDHRNAPSPARRKRGRPKGSRNAEKEASARAEESASLQQCTFCEFRSKSRQEIRVHSKEKHFAKHINKAGKSQNKDAAKDSPAPPSHVKTVPASRDKSLKKVAKSEGTLPAESVEQKGKDKARVESVHVCQHCTLRFTELTSLLEHQASVHPEEPENKTSHTCRLCGHSEKKPGLLFVHINKKHGKKLGSGQCPFQGCNREFGSGKEMKDHLNDHWIKKRYMYACQICGQRYQVLNSLKAHLERHKQDLPNLCKVCQLSFKTPGTLIRHQKQRGHLPKS